MSARRDDAARENLIPAVQQLAKDVRLRGGRMALPEEAFLKWKGEHERVAPHERERHAEDLVALAVRFHREGGPNAEEAIAQLYVLAAVLLGHSRAAASFKAAGIGWSPKPKGGAGGGWGSKR